MASIHMTQTKIDNLIKSSTWAQLQRFKFIERQLLWHRSIQSSHLVDAFGVTRQCAHQDISTYKTLAPRNMQPYSASDRTYKASINFKPVLLKEDLEGIVSTGKFATSDTRDAVFVPKLERKLIDGLVPVLLSAIDQGASIKAMYASQNSPEGAMRIMHPVCIIFTLNRPHLRAYCRQRNEYRDFVLSRFLTLPSFVSPNLIPDDTDFAENVTLRLIVNPQLNDSEFKMISKEFGISNSKEVEIKRCCLNYFLRENNLPATHEQMEEAQQNPWSYPVIPVYDTEMFYN